MYIIEFLIIESGICKTGQLAFMQKAKSKRISFSCVILQITF